MNLRPYMYIVLHKNVIEEIKEEFLKQELIRASNSPFAAPSPGEEKRWWMEDVCGPHKPKL